MILQLPDPVRKVMQALQESNAEVYLVGGAVRDSLMNLAPKDYDIATTAGDYEISGIARSAGWRFISNLGHNLGTCMVIVEGISIEISILRPADGIYETITAGLGRKSSGLLANLAHRDFTMNAMAWTWKGELVDPFAGAADINNRLIRAVGDPLDRFTEDPLRMLRACRLSAQLGFDIAEGTAQAISQCLDQLTSTPVDRVREELQRMLIAQYPAKGLDYFVSTRLATASCQQRQGATFQSIPIIPELCTLQGLAQPSRYHDHDAWRHTLQVVEGVPSVLPLRWAALLHDIGKGLPKTNFTNKQGRPAFYGHEHSGASLASKILARLAISSEKQKLIRWLIGQHMRFHAVGQTSGTAAIQRWVRQQAQSGQFRNQAEMMAAFESLCVLGIADGKGKVSTFDVSKLQTVAGQIIQFAKNMPVHTRDLNYSAEQLEQIFANSDQVMRFLKHALSRVQQGHLVNEEEPIRQAALSWQKRNMPTEPLA